MSVFLGPDQLATESLLASDPDVRPWVEKYQRSRETVSQTDYEVRVISFFILKCEIKSLDLVAPLFKFGKIS